MNEEELFKMQNEKIRKREKIDIILAYMLIVILLGAILVVLYLKFIRKDNTETIPNEYLASVITLDEISSRFNNNMNSSGTYTSNVSGNSLNISYSINDDNKTINIPLKGGELVIEYESNNNEVETIYKEIASIICEYNGNDMSLCRANIEEVNIDNQIDGIKIMQIDNNITVYIDINKKLELKEIETYDSKTIVDVSKTNYNLEINNIKINNISVNSNDNKFEVSGNIKANENEKITILVKLYNENTELLKEGTYEYNNENKREFNVKFDLDDNLKLENISKYSIEISE